MFWFHLASFAMSKNLSVDRHELCQCEVVQHCTAKCSSFFGNSGVPLDIWFNVPVQKRLWHKQQQKDDDD